MSELDLTEIGCAICGDGVPYKVVYPQTVSSADFNAKVFSARRRPDRRHYRMVRCEMCGLLYSNPVLQPEAVTQLYRDSQQTYDSMVDDISNTYADFLAAATANLVPCESLMEVGCGSGFFLQRALDMGFKEVAGVEPSRDAIAKASLQVRDRIKQGMFASGLFPPNSFDVVCLFQVLDHVLEPNEVLAGIFDCLRPGGMVLGIQHDTTALSAKILGRRSPIIDVEHVYLFSRSTIQLALAAHGFRDTKAHSLANRYTLGYWASMFPLPHLLKRSVEWGLRTVRLDQAKVSLKAGNMAYAGRKPNLPVMPPDPQKTPCAEEVCS